MSRKMFLLALALAVGCSDSSGSSDRFLDGTADNPEIGLVINSVGKALTMFQLGNPSEQRQIPFGASGLITPVGLSVRGTRALVPLGQTASTALVDLESEQIERFFTYPSGNTTGSAWLDDNTFLVANTVGGYVGKGTVDQVSNEITDTVDVAPAPTAIVMAGNRAFIVSSNYDENYVSLGNGIVTAIDPVTMTVIDDVETGDPNSTAAAIGPDGKLYVVNTGDYTDDASVTIIDPATLTVETTVGGFLAGSGSIRIEDDGLAYVSSAFGDVGTVIWNTANRTFVRGIANPVCPENPCRGAFDANRAEDGSLYQAFTGDPSHTPQPLAPYVFVYAPNTYQLVDSISAGTDPTSIDIARFREP
jgi:hypothetical protein